MILTVGKKKIGESEKEEKSYVSMLMHMLITLHFSFYPININQASELSDFQRFSDFSESRVRSAFFFSDF